MTEVDDRGDGDGMGARDAIAMLKDEPVNPHLLRGYGPLAIGVVLFLLMVLLAPTVAPEHIVVRPVSITTTTTTTAPP